MKDDKLKLIVSDEIARRIRTEREKWGYSRYALAQKAGIDAGHLQRIEEGRFAIRIDVLQKICVALRLEITFPV